MYVEKLKTKINIANIYLQTFILYAGGKADRSLEHKVFVPPKKLYFV